MPIARSVCSLGTACRLSCLMVGCAISGGAVLGQVNSEQPKKLAYAADPASVPDAIARLKSSNFGLVHVEVIAEFRAVEAIPALKDQFSRSQDTFTKEKIADALVRLGDKDDTYWNFLVAQATPVIESPDPRVYDAQGKAVRGPLSPEFVAWAKSNDLPADPVYMLPARVGLLAETGDPRGIPLLRRGLLSPNHLIQSEAARGLGKIHDKASIPLIIDACRNAPPEGAAIIARSLLYFDDPQARSAVDKYMPADTVKAYREAWAQGVRP